MSSSDENSDANKDPHWKASKHRSKFCRSEREINELDVSQLGPTKANALPWSPHLSTLLCGVDDPSHPLRVLRGQESVIIKNICQRLVETWREHIVLTPPAHAVGAAVPDCAWDFDATKEDYENNNHVYIVPSRGLIHLGTEEENRPEIAFFLVGTIEFPPPKGRNVNMLPFVMGNEKSLPRDLRPYYMSVIAKCPVNDEEYGKVLYLTISEGVVEASNTQRRSGLHVEAASGVGGVGGAFEAGTESNWGGGVGDWYCGDLEGKPDTFDGGLYMASNKNDTCMLWDALIAKKQGIVDYHGGGEHLRPFIGKRTKLKANELAWLTDRTPHEALGQTTTGCRQFFRLVTSNISVWFKQHSTANPKVPVPDHVQIIDTDKFGATAAAAATAATAASNEGQPKKRKAAPSPSKLRGKRT